MPLNPGEAERAILLYETDPAYWERALSEHPNTDEWTSSAVAVASLVQKMRAAWQPEAEPNQIADGSKMVNTGAEANTDNAPVVAEASSITEAESAPMLTTGTHPAGQAVAETGSPTDGNAETETVLPAAADTQAEPQPTEPKAENGSDAEAEPTLLNVVKTLYEKGKTAASKLFNRSFFDVAKTPDFMKKLGLTGEKFTIRYGVISRHFGKDARHNLPLEVWEQLPDAIQKPFAITKYFVDDAKQQQKGYRLYTTLRLADGSYVVVSADVKNAGKELEVNAVNTVFGRDAISEVHDELIYTSKEITPEQQALLDGNNPHQYLAEQELSTDKDTPSVAKKQEDAAEKDIDEAKIRAALEALKDTSKAQGIRLAMKLSDKELAKAHEMAKDRRVLIQLEAVMESREEKRAADKTGQAVADAAKEVDVNPTEAQKEAGNYRKGHVRVDGMDISIEQSKGSVRRGTDADGKQWESEMHDTYGYIRGSVGVDGDHIDVFLSDHPDKGGIFVVDQVDPKTGKFDEHKVMYGYADEEEAKAAYLANYEKGWRGLGAITAVSREDFRKWVDSSRRKTKPFSEYSMVKKAAGLQSEGVQKGTSSLTDEEVASITGSMKANATIAPRVEINDENWKDTVETPIGTVKMGENQKTKLFVKGRENQYGMLLETLQNPDIVLEEEDAEQNTLHERPSSYLFVKTFEKEDGSKYIHFESVTVSQNGLEVSISSHIIRENQLKNKMKKDRLLFVATALDASANTSAEQPIVGGSHSSEGKGSEKISDEKEGKQTKYNGYLDGKTKLTASAIGRNLSKRINIGGAVKSIAEHIEGWHKDGGLKVEANEYMPEPNRRRWNRMSQDEQDAWEAAHSKPKTQYLAGYGKHMYELGKTAYDYAKWLLDSDAAAKQSADGRVALPTAGERALRDAVVERMRESGLDVITDDAEGQRVLDEVNGNAKLSAKKRRALETVSVPRDEKHQPTVVSSAAGAKVLKELDTTKEKYENQSNRTNTFLGDVANALGANRHGSTSEYATFETRNGRIVTIRLANHNATVSNFDNHGESEGISIVVSPKQSEDITNDGSAHIVEYYYNALKLRRADGKPLAEILRSIKQALYSGEFTDTTGLAERQEVNADDVVRYNKVYHGSAADFDSFDHSHMGEGEGASEFLSSLGFVGIKYPADFMRGGRADGKKNYVIFNEADARITDHVRFFRTADGEAYGFTVGGKIYIDPRVAKADTPIHEYSHLWSAAMREANPGEWANIVELMRGTGLWDEVKARYPELETDDDIADEVLAHYSGSRGAERLRAEQQRIIEGDATVLETAAALSALERVKEALRRFWKGVADFLHIHFTSAEEVADRVLHDLLHGFDPRKYGKSTADDAVKYHIVRDKKELERLDKEKKFRMYGAMQERDGKLYSPMAAVIDGKLTDATEIGTWMKADEHPELVDDNGNFLLVKAIGKKGAGEGDVPAAYNPYMHTSTSMMNDQFTGAYARGNIRVVEWEIPEYEKTSGYHADKAKNAVGLVPWHSGSVNSLLPKDRQRQVMLSQYRKAVRVVPDAEVAKSIARQLAGTDLAIPWNTVTPNQVKELAKLGVPITTEASGTQGAATKSKFLKQMDELKALYPQAKFVSVKMTKDAYAKWGKGRDAGEGVALLRKNGDGKEKQEIEDVNRKFNEELQQQINGTLLSNHIYKMGKPGKVLLSTGVPDLPIQMNAKRLQDKATLFDHDFDLSEVKDLVKALQSPLAVFAYGNKTKAQNIIIPLQKGGKNFIVGLSLNPTVGGKSLEINSIRNVFPKDNSEWLNWINQGKTLYLDKEKIQILIDQQRTNLADVDYLDLDSVAKVIENFENPKSPQVLEAQPTAADGFAALPKSERRAAVEREVSAVDVELGTHTVVADTAELSDAMRDAVERGGGCAYYDPATGETVVLADRALSAADVRASVVHENIGHKSLDELLGGKAGDFYREVAEHIATAEELDALRKDCPEADGERLGSEWMAHLSETEAWKKRQKRA